jgi:CRISPR/Cas system CMR-associated protein Cmr3 (group 5 of RAMP superfamily)
VLEASFENLYGVTPLTDDQKTFYEKKYFGFIDPRFLQLVVDNSNRLQGFFLGLPSLSRSFQRAQGRLFPFGFLHILRGFKRFDTVDFYFAGVHPQANIKKVLPMMTIGMWRALKAANVRYLETNRELETNTSVVNIWSRFAVVNRRRTRVFRKDLFSASS